MKNKFLVGIGIFVLVIFSIEEVFSQEEIREPQSPMEPPPTPEPPVSFTVIKVVDGGSAHPDHFKLTVNGELVNSGEEFLIDSGTLLTISETQRPNYEFESISGAGCPTNLDEEFTITQDTICTVTNVVIPQGGLSHFPQEPDMEDFDADGVSDNYDNCPKISNPDQIDSDENGRGDACDWEVMASISHTPPEVEKFQYEEPVPIPQNIPSDSNFFTVSEKCKKLPRVFHVGINADRISNIDLKEGTFDAQFWVWVYPNNPEMINFEIDEPPLDYVNAQTYNTSRTEIIPHYYVTKVEGTFFTDFDFTYYPFEKISLPIIIEPYNEGICETFFVIDDRKWEFFGLTKGSDRIGGYKIIKTNISEGIENYKIFEDPEKYGASHYSRVTSSVDLEKPLVPTFFQFIFPIVLLSFLAILVFVLPIESDLKIEYSAIFLVSMVFYSQIVKFESSFITTFSLFDYVVSASYGIFLITILIPGYQIFKGKIKK